MMRLLIVSCVYPPEPSVSAQTSAQLATAMASRGHAVTVVAPFPSHPAGRIYPPFHRKALQVTREPNGIRIIRTFATISPKSTIWSRSLENLSFGLGAAVVAALLDKPDVVYVNTWPILAQALIRLVGRLRRVPIVLSIQDMYPESLISQDRVTGDRPLVRAMTALDGWIARGAAEVVVISEAFARKYEETRGVPSDRLHCVPNWIKEDSFTIPDDISPSRVKYGIRAEEALFVYGGNIGAAAGVETVIAALQSTPETSPCRLLIAGEGSELKNCRELAGDLPGRISFVSPWPLVETAEVLAAADALVLPTRNRQSLSSVPSKLLTYLLAGKPILAAVLPESDTARVLAEAGCGWVVAPDDPAALGQLMEQVARLSASELQERGRRGRQYVLENFGQKQAIGRLVSLLESQARQSGAAPARSEGQ